MGLLSSLFGDKDWKWHNGLCNTLQWPIDQEQEVTGRESYRDMYIEIHGGDGVRTPRRGYRLNILSGAGDTIGYCIVWTGDRNYELDVYEPRAMTHAGCSWLDWISRLGLDRHLFIGYDHARFIPQPGIPRRGERGRG